MKKAVKIILLGLGAFTAVMIIIGIIVAVSTGKTESKTDRVEPVTDSSRHAITTQTAAPASRWEYTQQEDKMTSNTEYYADIEANDELQLKFPYAGGVTATLHVRKKEGKNEVYLRLSKGQLIAANGLDDAVRLRFDDERPGIYGVTGAADYSSEVIFFDSPTKIISKLKKAKRLIVEAAVFDNGTQIMEFNTDGFVWNH